MSRARCLTCRSMTSIAHSRSLLRRRQLARTCDGVADRRERVAQLVGEHRQELVLPPVGLPERLLGSLPVGDVRDEHHHAPDLPCLVPVRRVAGVEAASLTVPIHRLVLVDDALPGECTPEHGADDLPRSLAHHVAHVSSDQGLAGLADQVS